MIVVSVQKIFYVQIKTFLKDYWFFIEFFKY